LAFKLKNFKIKPPLTQGKGVDGGFILFIALFLPFILLVCGF